MIGWLIIAIVGYGLALLTAFSGCIGLSKWSDEPPGQNHYLKGSAIMFVASGLIAVLTDAIIRVLP